MFFFIFCFCLYASRRGVRRNGCVGEEVETAILICKIAAVVATGVGTALPESLEVFAHDELLDCKPTPAYLQAPEHRVHLLDEEPHVYARVRLAGNKTDVLVECATVLGVIEQNTGELARARGCPEAVVVRRCSNDICYRLRRLQRSLRHWSLIQKGVDEYVTRDGVS